MIALHQEIPVFCIALGQYYWHSTVKPLLSELASLVPVFHEYWFVIFSYDSLQLFSFKLCDETQVQTEFVLLQITHLCAFHSHTNAFHLALF